MKSDALGGDLIMVEQPATIEILEHKYRSKNWFR